MPRIGESAVQSAYGFSKARLADFGATEYTLVVIRADSSGSIAGHAGAIEAAIQNIIESCRKSPRAGNLLVSVGTFDSGLHEIHDFKLLKEIADNEYAGSIIPRGMTCLRDSAVDMYRKFEVGAKDLRNHDYEVNAIGFILTDGEDTASSYGVAAVAQACKDLVISEAVDSYRSVLIAINNSNPHFHQKLAEFAKDCGFDQVIDAGDATPKALNKLTQFVSQSISSQNGVLGTGAPSQPTTF